MEIKFDELNISRDSTTIEVNARVVNDTGEGFVITNISIDSCATFNEMLGHPSGNPLVSEDFASEEVSLEVEDSTKFKNKMLFVWVTASDGFDTVYSMKPLINWYAVYQKAMCYIKHLPCKTCKPPMGFIDFILKIKGIEYSLETENYTQAIRLWKSLNTRKASDMEDDCGCN